MLVKSREYRSRGEAVTHLVFDQAVDGLPVFGGRMQVQIGADGAVLGVAHTAIPVASGTRRRHHRRRCGSAPAIQQRVSRVASVLKQ